jgi:hypothetical protein
MLPRKMKKNRFAIVVLEGISQTNSLPQASYR